MAPAGFGSRVEGVHAVLAALSAGRVEKLWAERSRLEGTELGRAIDTSGVVVSIVPDVRPMAETESPQGVVARCSPLEPVALDSMGGAGAAVVVLDHVQDPHNLGAVARSAAAAGMTGLVVAGRRSAPLSATAFKTAAGALERLPVCVVGSIPEALSRMGGIGLWTVGLAAGTGSSLFGLGLLTEPVALVLGAEGRGLSELTAKRCEVLVSIPMVGDVESLNVSVAAGIACFEVARVRGGLS